MAYPYRFLTYARFGTADLEEKYLIVTSDTP